MFGGGIIKGASQTYGVGKTAGGVNIGSYALLVKVDSVTADGAAVDPIYQQNATGMDQIHQRFFSGQPYS
jgi:hypothetical protein